MGSKGGGSGITAQAFNQFQRDSRQPQQPPAWNQVANQVTQRPNLGFSERPVGIAPQPGLQQPNYRGLAGMMTNIFGTPFGYGQSQMPQQNPQGGFRPTGFAPTPINQPLTTRPAAPWLTDTGFTRYPGAISNDGGWGTQRPNLGFSERPVGIAPQPGLQMTGVSPVSNPMNFGVQQPQQQQWGHAGWLARGRQPYGGAY